MLLVRRLLPSAYALRTVPRLLIPSTSLIRQPAYSFAKISKKKEEKIEKSKEKEQARSKVGNSKQIDLATMEKEFKHTAESMKTEMQKMKLGRMDPAIFSTIYVKAYGQTSPISQLAQVVEKNMNTCIVSPYSEEAAVPIMKGLEASGQNFTLTRKEQQIIVTQASSSTKQAKQMMLTKVKKLHEDTREKLRKQRSKHMEQIKDYKKFSQEDAIKQAESELQKIFESVSKEIDATLKAKEKELQ